MLTFYKQIEKLRLKFNKLKCVLYVVMKFLLSTF